MSEWDFSPHSYGPKPLTRAQLREMEKQFADVSHRLDKIKEIEGNHKDDIEHPKWL